MGIERTARLFRHLADPGPSALALRLAGNVHALALAGRAPQVARHYPSTEGDARIEAAWRAVRRLIADAPRRCASGSPRRPRPTRWGAPRRLGAVLRLLARVGPRQVRLWEIGVDVARAVPVTLDDAGAAGFAGFRPRAGTCRCSGTR